jgi:hypothetical protein
MPVPEKISSVRGPVARPELRNGALFRLKYDTAYKDLAAGNNTLKAVDF